MFNILHKMKFWKKASLLGSLMLMNTQKCYGEEVINIGMRALVLSTEKPETILSSLASYGIPYDNLIYNCENPIEEELYLLDENTGDPKYNMIILASGAMKCKCYGSVESALKDEHWKALRSYEAKYNIRRVTFNEAPEDATDIGCQIDANKYNKPSSLPILGLNNKFTEDLFDNAGVYRNAPMNTLGLHYEFAKISNPKIATPVLRYDIKDVGKGSGIAAVYSKLEDGTERLTFFLSSSARNPSSLILNHLWIPWVSKYLYTGYRRIYLSQHIDDVFTSSKLIPTADKYYDPKKIYKSTVADFNNISKYQSEIVKKMPAGSSYRLELVFNGNGILDDSSYKFDVTVDEYVPNDYVKPRGSGICRWPEFPYNASWLESELDKNYLFAFFKEKEAHEKYYWTSHGFTHQRLDTATATDVKSQVDTNNKMAVRLGFSEKDIFSKHTIVTPHSSGLHNVDAIETFMKASIETAFGNINRDDICNDENNEKGAYIPWRTTLESSNIDGFSVIPRIPTMLFNQCSTPLENTVKYNKIFEGTGMGATFDEILNRDTQQALLYLLQLRHNPFRFHQANLRCADLPNKKSMVEQWTEKLLEKYNKYVKWPIISLKSDDLRTSFFEREKYESCDLTQQLLYNGTHIVGLTLSTVNRSCRIPVALPKDISVTKNDLNLLKDILSIEQVNEFDPITIWIRMNDNSITLHFEPAILWGESKINKTLKKKSTQTDYIEKVDGGKGKYTAHRLVSNIITNVLKYGSKTNEMKKKIGYTTEQLKNIKALKELEKSRLYAEGVGKIQESRKKEEALKKYLKDQKDYFYNSIEYELE